MRSTPPDRLTGIRGGLALADGLQNAITGAGTSADKNFYNRYVQCAVVQPAEVEAAYRTSWLVRKVHDLPPLDMTREWRDWQAGADEIGKLEAEERRLGLHAKVHDVLLWARLYGGSALILGYGDADPSKPAPKVTRAGGLKYVNAVTRYSLTYEELDRDPLSELYGQPKMWKLGGAGTMVDIHPSRVIPFIGQPIPRSGQGQMMADDFWGDPLLESIKTAAANSDVVQNGIAALIHEAKTDIFGIPNLMDMVGTEEGERRLMRRLEVAQLGKSMHNAYIRDAAETWEQKEFTFGTLPDVGRLFLMIAAGAADIPATRLLGKSADGMNSTGEGDERNYLAMISTRQSKDLAPQLHRLDEALIPSALGSSPADVYWEFAPLDVPTDAQKAETEKKRAEATKIYADTGLVPQDALAKGVQNQLLENGVYPGFDQALEEAEAALDVPDVAEEGDPVDTPLDTPPAEVTDAAPRTLDVRRNVVNASDFIAWAKAQGFETTVPADDLHVTIAFSRVEVDWMKVGTDWGEDSEGRITIPAGGARLVEPLGDKGAIVLLFNSSQLAWRHEQIKRDADASWDYEGYQPHVTITYHGGDMDLTKIEPYRGKIVLGPEIFEEVQADWEKGLKEA